MYGLSGSRVVVSGSIGSSLTVVGSGLGVVSGVVYGLRVVVEVVV